MIGLDDTNDELFSYFKYHKPYMKALCLGNDFEQEIFQHWFGTSYYEVISRPVNNNVILERIKVLIQVSEIEKAEREEENQRKMMTGIEDQLDELMADVDGFGEVEAEEEHDVHEESVESILENLKAGRLSNERRKIMLIDDNAVQLRALRGNLIKDYDILLATSGGEALKIMEKNVRAEAKGLTFIQIIDPTLPSVLYGDDVRIKQIIINLLTNAVKYTPQGQICLEIQGQLTGEEVELMVRVSDTGIGIKEEDLGKLFKTFERIEEERNRNIEGTGLGMAITASLLEMMGSQLDVKSEYGKGSIFSFRLKQKVICRDSIGSLEDHCGLNGTMCVYQPALLAPDAHILVVDDNEMNRKVFKSLLKKTMLQIDQASSGFECLSMTKEKHYDLIFLDHMMPKMDGIETFQKIRADEQNACQNTPVVVLTANAIAGVAEEYRKQGFDYYLSKPVVPENLEKVIRNFLPRELMQEEESAEEILKAQG